MARLVDSYSESNHDTTTTYLYNGWYTKVGQSFTAISGKLSTAKFYIKKFGSPTGNVTVELFTHSGTYGTSSVGTGAALATSNAIDISTLTTDYALVTFTFSGANKYKITAGTKYVLTVGFGGGDINNRLYVGNDTSSPTHSGNGSQFIPASTWLAQSGWDVPFYLYADTFAGYKPMAITAKPLTLKPLKFKRVR